MYKTTIKNLNCVNCIGGVQPFLNEEEEEEDNHFYDSADKLLLLFYYCLEILHCYSKLTLYYCSQMKIYFKP